MNPAYKDYLTASRWFFRSLKQGDWLWLFLAVALASLSVTTVDLLAKTVKQSMLRDAANQLGADLVLKSTRPLNPAFLEHAQTLGLKTAESITLTTMASQGDDFKLVQLKGISSPTPLRGELKTTALFNTPNTALNPQTIWVEKALLAPLGITPQTKQITLGTQNFEVVATLSPSGLASGMSSFAPTIWMDLSNIANTKLIGPGSRVGYELSLAGDIKALEAFNQFAQPLLDLDSSTQIISASAPNDDLAKSLDTAWLFLDLAALSAVLVAGLSILIASRFYVQRWQTQVALLRALGAGSRSIRRLLTWQLMWLGLLASGLGFVLGTALFQGLWPWLTQFFESPVSPDYLTTLFKSWALGLLVLWSFTWQALQIALKTSAMALFRHGQLPPSVWHWVISFGLLLLLMGLIVQSASPKQMAWVLLGLVAVGSLLYLSASLLLKVINAWQNHAHGWFKLSLSSLSREPGLVKIQLVSVGLVLFVLMLLTFVRQDLMQSWQASLPADTPDSFIMNVQPDQKDITQQLLQQAQVEADLVPMVKGRLVQLNQQPVVLSDPNDQRGKNLLEREANIGVLNATPSHNITVAQSKLVNDLPKVSVEKSIADLFSIQLDDTLTFNFSGQESSYQVDSIRTVEWQSFRLNFFFILTPSDSTETLPISYISSFKMPDPTQVSPLQKQLSEQAPGVLLIDVKGILTQIQTIMSQASWAVTALYGLTLLASILVLLSATQASQQSRVQSWMLLKTLGAKQTVILKMGLMEFVLLGALAGIIAASLAQVASMVFSLVMLDVAPSINPALWLASLSLGMFGWLAMGWITQRRYLQRSAKDLSRYEVY